MSQHFGESLPELNDLREEIAEDGKGALDTIEGILTGQVFDDYDLRLRVEVLCMIVRLQMRWTELVPTLETLQADRDGWLAQDATYADAVRVAYTFLNGTAAP